MSKDPAVLWYSNDFISGTYTMTDEQVGKYVRLLCLQHQKGHLTEKDMLFICKSYDIDIYSKFTKDGDVYYNKRMRIETERRQKYSESRKTNRLSNKDEENVKSYVKHMETVTETINKDISLVVNKRRTEILEYCKVQGYSESEGESFYDHYQALGWQTSAGMGIVDWKAKMRTWHKEQIEREKKNGTSKQKFNEPKGSIDPDKYKRLAAKEPII